MTIHPSALVAGDARLGTGTVVGPFVVLGLDGAEDLDPLEIGDGSRVRSHTVLYRGTTIGRGFHAGHGAMVREQTHIGDNVSIGSHTMIEHHVEIGDDVRVHSNAFIPEHTVLEPGCWIGPSVTVTNARYPNRPDTKQNLEGVHVGSGAVIGANAVLLPGVVVGAGAIVGAGTVVVRDVDPGATVVGNPGRSS